MGRQVTIKGYCEDEIQKTYKAHHKTDYKMEAKRAAKDLAYGPKVIKMIENAENDEEIRRIMHDARNGLL